MGKIKDMFATQIKEHKNYEKKQRWEKTKPRFIYYDITLQKVNDVGLQELDIVVTDILDINDKRRIITKAKTFDENGLILKITCPICGKDVKLNKHWNAFICDSTEHEKKVYEIKNIEYKVPKKIVEIGEEW